MKNVQNLTTLCYIEREDSYLMLHRVSKKNDINKDKWIGIGGHFQVNESPEDCLLREAKEETSIDVELKDLVNVYSNPDRDPRGHTITIAYTAKGDFLTRKADDDAADIDIFSPEKLDEINIAFDHKQIIKDCLNKAKND